MHENPRTLDVLSIVVPCHNERENTAELAKAVASVLTPAKVDFELIFVDDSTDETPLIIEQLHNADPRIKLRRLTRRFGQNAAIFAGLEAASGSAVVVMDADLEDPPSNILRLLEGWRNGYDVVLFRRKRSGVTWLYGQLSRMYYGLVNRLADIDIPPYVGEFRLLDRRVVEFTLQLPERLKFFRGLSIWAGHRTLTLDLQRDARQSGVTNYNLRRSFAVAVDSILSFSFMPLRLISFVGIGFGLAAAILAFGYLVWRFIDPKIFGVGWMSLFLVVLASSAINLICLGIVAEYVGRIFRQIQGRPSHVVDYDVGIANDRPGIASSVKRTTQTKAS